MLIVTYAECHIYAFYAECHYDEHHYAECRSAFFYIFSPLSQVAELKNFFSIFVKIKALKNINETFAAIWDNLIKLFSP
jgi:hypothetical protein